MENCVAPVSVDRLRQVLTYDASAGQLYWLPREGSVRFNSRYAGKPAFSAVQSAGYPHGTVDGHFLLAHRVAWALHFGYWPDRLDHMNGDRADYRICNLRQVDQAENMRNVARSTRNTSGVTGVSFNAASNKWAAYISARDGLKHLGYFACKTAAMLARKAAEARHGYHPNHGRAV